MRYNIIFFKNNELLEGIFAVISASFFFSLMGLFIKLSATNLSVLEIIFIRFFFGLVILLFIIKKKKISVRSKIMHLHLIRTIFGLLGMFCIFYSITKLPLSSVATLSFSKIFFIIPLAIFFLKERILTSSLLYILLGYIGILIVLGFEAETTNYIYYIFTLLGAFFIALLKILVKKIAISEDAIVIQFWFSFISFFILLIPFFFVAQTPIFDDLIFILFATTAGLIAQYLTIFALKKSDATIVMPFEFSRVIFGIILGISFLGENISFSIFFGAAILIFSGFFLAKNYTRTKKFNLK